MLLSIFLNRRIVNYLEYLKVLTSRVVESKNYALLMLGRDTVLPKKIYSEE